MLVAERNKRLKAVLVREFGKGNVTVRGARGTAYGWVSVKIATPDWDRDGLRARVWDLIRKNDICIDKYGYDDPGSDYGYGSKISIDFKPEGGDRGQHA